MKITFVSFMRVLPWGGSEELWYKTAKLALELGHTVGTLTQQWEEVPDKIKELQLLGAEAAFYKATQYGLGTRLAIKLGLKLREADVVPAVQADLFVVSNGSTWDFLQHQELLTKLLGRGTPYVFINQHSFETGSIVGESHREYALSVLGQAQKNFFVAERNRLVAERQLGSHIGQATVVSNPVNIRERGIKSYPTGEELTLACVARLDCNFKGQDILLQALSAGPWPARSYRLRFYGSGPHRQHLGHLIDLYQLGDKVSIEGHVADVDAIWLTNQVLVLPSLSEGTPLALVEAMLSGRAAVTTDVGDSGKYVLNGRTGYLAATASVNCLAASLEELWLNRHNLQQLGEAAFAHAAAITDFEPHKTIWKSLQTATPEQVNNS